MITDMHKITGINKIKITTILSMATSDLFKKTVFSMFIIAGFIH